MISIFWPYPYRSLFIILTITVGLIFGVWYKTQTPDKDAIRDAAFQMFAFSEVTDVVKAPFWECGIHARAYVYVYGRRRGDSRLYEGVACIYSNHTTFTLLP